jgi:polyhydroxyalkanoate synthesis repressor PhaR
MRASYNESNGDRSAGVDVAPREVRRYPNRRMYDARSKSYVALDEIAQWIDAGQRVRVLDLKTNEDVTIAVLLPLLLDRLSRSLRGDAATQQLHEWIRAGDLPTAAPPDPPPPQALTVEERLARLELQVASLEKRGR